MSTYDPTDEAFDDARKKFRDNLKDQKLYNDILADATTIDDVCQMAAKLQEDAASRARMRNFRRLRTFLDVLAGYGQVIEVFVQVKPEILALIWGPIRLILKWSNELSMAWDAVAEVIVKISQALPQFSELVNVFRDNSRVKAALVLFYGDILHFYRVLLKMLRNPGWKQIWEMIWKQTKNQVDDIIKKIAEHVLLMRNEVSIAEIIKADKARDRSLAHFKEVQEFQELQKFQGLRTHLDPPQYGERLDWLRNRVHKGSPKWLLQDKVFQEWLDMSKQEVTWLWIRGIPGSGKTYLAAAAVDEAIKKHQTLFVFASYNEQKSTTALSITQSLVFQAAAENHVLQNMVVEFSERDLTSDGRKVLELLTALLSVSAGTYIIVDGLDEVDEPERRILLQRLDEMVCASNNLKILICSRPEDDITQTLSKKSKSLRVDHRNTASIQSFVDHKILEWMAYQDFTQQTMSEVNSLLSPLAARANGMFLYARIVLDNLMELSSVEEIRQELRALPTDLNDAYQRVFNKINSSQPRMREKIRKILGWIGCAPAAMTSLEMEQALSLDASVEKIPSIIGSINFVKLCGPIIEIVNDKPQFVHFTVREYIFSHEISNFIDIAFANETLAIANVSYLCSGVFDLDSTDSKSDVQDSILAGNYRLLGYVAWYWAGLTLVAAQNKSFSTQGNRLETLSALISRAISEISNYDFEPDEESFQPKIEDYTLDFGSREGRDMLHAACRFRRDERQPDWTVTNANTWVNLDPLVTSKIMVRVKENFESLLCDNDTHNETSANGCTDKCHWATLLRHYGARFYKCSYFSCPYSRNGFVSRKSRDDHEQAHGRPWKCPSTTCQFSVIGFSSSGTRDVHVKRFHEAESEPMVTVDAEMMAASDFDNLDEYEVQPLLFVLVRTGNVEAIQRLQASSSGNKIRSNVLSSARTIAAKQGSMAMTKLLTPDHEIHLPVNIVSYAVESADAEFAKWALAKADPDDINTGKLNKVMLSSPSDEIYSLWETTLLNYPRVFKTLLKTSVFNGVKDNPLREERLTHTWKLIWQKRHGEWSLSRINLSKGLLTLAKSTTSVKLGTALLQLGASTEYGWRTASGRTALGLAAKKTTREAAEFMKMLLEHGALVSYTRRATWYGFGKEAGAQGIQQWLGITWAELVEKNKDVRKQPCYQEEWGDLYI
ncbi:hypothetical protein F5Y09DRAFT_300802 [Xylaria sp. FL1042]|nr:hypothetical protein F5Y09DRAFT_300802 [Xylaria sp. FL1042]